MCRYRGTDGTLVVSIVSATGEIGAVDMSASDRVDSIAITATTRKKRRSARPGPEESCLTIRGQVKRLCIRPTVTQRQGENAQVAPKKKFQTGHDEKAYSQFLGILAEIVL
jgi:hypothetical protein